MRREHLPWLLLTACLGVWLGVLGWTTCTVLRLDESEHKARLEASREEKVRLALWRMDSFLAGLVSQENSRPYHHYRPLFPAGAAYNRMLSNISKDDVLIPSPLMNPQNPEVKLRFQVSPEGVFSSPQVPSGLTWTATKDNNGLPEELFKQGQARLNEIGNLFTAKELAATCSAIFTTENTAGTNAWWGNDIQVSNSKADIPVLRQQLEAGNNYAIPQQQAAELNTRRNLLNKSNYSKGMDQQQAYETQPDRTLQLVTQFAPVWVKDELLLVRQVVTKSGTFQQSVWLDWPQVRRELLELIPDLLAVPGTDFRPTGPNHTDPRRLLASLPLELVPAFLAEPPAEGLSPLVWSLGVAWVLALAGVAGLGLMLRGVLVLSERRATFVSAVTHELRTPLTTFQLYAEMLAEGMVPEESKRREYLRTLQQEAIRLSHLVENVLGFSQLEQGGKTQRRESFAVAELLERSEGRLRMRTEEAGMSFIWKDLSSGELRLRTDAGSVEQILLNLVDNAAKYATPGGTIRVEAAAEGRRAVIRVVDAGPGVSPSVRKKLFRPFSRSAEEAAGGKPGVGLGLALSRQLARGLGGDLELEKTGPEGTVFKVTLPAG